LAAVDANGWSQVPVEAAPVPVAAALAPLRSLSHLLVRVVRASSSTVQTKDSHLGGLRASVVNAAIAPVLTAPPSNLLHDVPPLHCRRPMLRFSLQTRQGDTIEAIDRLTY
jgi:hypothetical protein